MWERAFKYIWKERLKSNTKWRLTEVEKHLLREECQKEASFAVQREEVSAEWNDKHKGDASWIISNWNKTFQVQRLRQKYKR